MTLRLASRDDAEAILSIYAPYILNTAISFETVLPSVEEFAGRIEKIGAKYPYLICLEDNKAVGFAYASAHRERAAYCYDVEVSIYVDESFHSTGAASLLYTCLFRILKEQGFCNAYAAYTEPNEKSRRFHQKMGFNVIGTHHKTGYKLGRWHDVTWLERTINEHSGNPQPVVPIKVLPKELLAGIIGQ